jgi:hypothetical protein
MDESYPIYYVLTIVHVYMYVYIYIHIPMPLCQDMSKYVEYYVEYHYFCWLRQIFCWNDPLHDRSVNPGSYEFSLQTDQTIDLYSLMLTQD